MEIKIGNKAIDLIIFSEVSSPAYYKKFLLHPIWPKGESGVTVGIGYDLGHQTVDKIKKDWGNDVSPKELAILCKAAGVRGTKAQDLLKKDTELKNLIISFERGKAVFIEDSLPDFVKQTLNIYPGLEELGPDAIGALVSIVYNRGASLKGSSRAEMAAIAPLVKKKDYSGIADQIIKMKRLWQGKSGMQGILTRRDNEAKLVKAADRDYSETEYVIITV